MKELAAQVRTFVYTMILFQCLIQLASGSSFYRYLKLFSQLLAVSICCHFLVSFFGVIDSGWEQADKIYEAWEAQWSDGRELTEAQGYLERQIMEDAVEEWKAQTAELLETEGKGAYELCGITQKKNGVWEIALRKRLGEDADEEFPGRFRQAVCQKFSMQEKEVEVRLQ